MEAYIKAFLRLLASAPTTACSVPFGFSIVPPNTGGDNNKGYSNEKQGEATVAHVVVIFGAVWQSAVAADANQEETEDPEHLAHCCYSHCSNCGILCCQRSMTLVH
jgi:hypothetical protein